MAQLKDYQNWKASNPLRVWRKEQGLTAFEAAARVGVSVQAMTRWESGASNPGDGSVEKLAAVMGRDEQDLIAEWAAWRKSIMG